MYIYIYTSFYTIHHHEGHFVIAMRQVLITMRQALAGATVIFYVKSGESDWCLKQLKVVTLSYFQKIQESPRNLEWLCFHFCTSLKPSGPQRLSIPRLTKESPTVSTEDHLRFQGLDAQALESQRSHRDDCVAARLCSCRLEALINKHVNKTFWYPFYRIWMDGSGRSQIFSQIFCVAFPVEKAFRFSRRVHRWWRSLVAN